MKSYKLFARLILILLLSFVGCRKHESPEIEVKPAELVAKAQAYYSQYGKTADTGNAILSQRLVPDWNQYLVRTTGFNEGELVVKTVGFEIGNPAFGAITSIVFSYKGGNVGSGKIVNVIGSADFIKSQDLNLSLKYKDPGIPGFNTGAFIVNGLDGLPISSHAMQGGKALNVNAALQKISKPDLVNRSLTNINSKRVAATHLSGGEEIGYGSGNCIDWYLVTYNADTGEILGESYVGRTCSGSSSGGNSGTTDQGPPPIDPAMVRQLIGKLHINLANPNELANFTAYLNAMDSTPVGDKILSAMESYYEANPTAKTLTVTDNMPASGDADYDPNTNTINMGNTYLNGNFLSYAVDQTAHEIYHAYEKINAQSPFQSNFELDAYMFGAQVIQGLAADAATQTYETQVEVLPPATTAQTQFNTAWTNYMNGNTSLQNYKVLDGYFLTGSSVGSNYKTYNGQTVTNSPGTIPLFLK